MDLLNSWYYHGALDVQHYHQVLRLYCHSTIMVHFVTVVSSQSHHKALHKCELND